MVNAAVELRLLAFPASKIVLNKRGTGVIHPKKFVSTLLIATCTLAMAPLWAAEEESNSSEPSFSGLISNPRQLTFAGRRSGEGYFNAEGDELVFQSEREPGNPFFQIYVLDLETGDEERISPGVGKTTCGWIHPDGNRVLFASTHLDKEAKAKQKQELDAREAGEQKRYSWDYDPTYELFAYDRKAKEYTQLTNELGYDAEASYSPDGSLIAFASNRDAYERELTAEEKEQLERDPAAFMEIYVMNADGSNVRQLTDVFGYDGGPFFSPDGKRICWRRFDKHGATAEIMTMNVDGSDVRQLTDWQVMSWAPFYHPSGEYLIFTTNRHGFSNFELYLVAADGQQDPIRVTNADGFDGLPVFSPDGNTLVWTSNRTDAKQSQLFRGSWNHKLALELLGKEGLTDDQVRNSARQAAAQSNDDFQAVDIARHVNFLCKEELAGRLTGTEGERLATAYVAAYFEELGLQPAGDEGTYFQEFEFTAGIDLGDTNQLLAGDADAELGTDWQPVSFSETGKFSAKGVAFAGYGLVAPGTEESEEYDSYVHLDVTDKWVVVFRYLPENITPERRQEWARFASLRYKAMVARDRGAKGMLVVSGPQSQVEQELIPLRFDGALAGSSIPVLSVSDAFVEKHLFPEGKSLAEYQKKLDSGIPQMGFLNEEAELTATIDIQQVKRKGRNVLGLLSSGDAGFNPALVVGAHIDHLGRGQSSSSLARSDEESQIHYGADDNASGVAAMLEVAEYLSTQKKTGKADINRDVLFAAWSGEELGLYGANHFVKKVEEQLEEFAKAHMAALEQQMPEKMKELSEKNKDGEKEAPEESNKEGEEAEEEGVPLRMAIAACLNMDMVGRFSDSLVLQGVGSSSIWKQEIERRNVVVGLPITLQNDSYIPTDASVFFMNGVPILSAFTGTHSDYHTPRDTPEKLNYEAAAKIARLMGLITRSLAMNSKVPDYVSQERPQEQRRANLRAYLGTIPDYAAGDVEGVQLSGVGKGGPADEAGVQQGDIIVELAGKKIDNIYDYTYAIEALKIGEETTIVVNRNGERKSLKITPGSRE